MLSCILRYMSCNPHRVKRLTNSEYKSGTVVYHMCRDIRAHDNDALLFAQQLAKDAGAELIVNYVIWNYKWEGATRRFYDWILPSLEEVEITLREHMIPLVITFENSRLFTKHSKDILPAHIGAVVIDQLPLRFMRKWKETFLQSHGDTPLYEVDAHNCIPVWNASEKQEFAAHTIRRKVHKLLPVYMETYDSLQKHNENEFIIKKIAPVNWEYVKKTVICREDVNGVGDFIPGEKAAHKMLTTFLHKKLISYDISRNAINEDGQSNLSPYISHGNISRRTIMLLLMKEINASRSIPASVEELFDSSENGSNGKADSIAAFIEECVVRAELSENFCYYNLSYDIIEGYPLWSKMTLASASTDERKYVYTRKQFEDASTHDLLWNAAELQMVTTGKMHGYMRMYWAKKILEWSPSPKEAMKTAVYLNDTYELDGRDPKGYVGCAWSIGGVHDRPWFKRPIFGAVRFMAESGVKKRGNIHQYITKWGSNQKTLL